jgi:exodeoxyribonuclease VII large subunit
MQLAHNDYGLQFYPRLFPAVMQGEHVEQSIIAALDAINREIHRYDVVVIIRGGGASADMSGFDTLALAENVANFPLPIITGIGHDRDESILDMVSHTRVKTPTAAAAFLIDHLAGVLGHIQACQDRILTRVSQRMERERSRLDRSAHRIPILFSLVKTRQESRLDRLSATLRQQADRSLTACHHRLQLLAQALTPATTRRLTGERHRLHDLSLRMQALDPPCCSGADTASPRCTARPYAMPRSYGRETKSKHEWSMAPSDPSYNHALPPPPHHRHL